MSRFHDNGAYEIEFQRGVAVRCPKCDRRALVCGDANGWRAKTARFSCTSCGYSASWNRGHYNGPVVGIAKRRSRTWQATPCDPYFGFQLWFIGEVKGNVFWAYNAAHLSFIRSYVQASLRIREPNKNSSLASRLPHFLLDRKNRNAVLKEIAALERA